MTVTAASTASLPILNISAYKFVGLDRLPERREQLLQLCCSLGLRGTILLSSEGINLFLAGQPTDIESFLGELRRDPAFADLQTKDSYSATQPFRRTLVRLKKEIIAFGIDSVAPEQKTSAKISPRELQAWLDEGRPVRLLDTRNIYEYDLGTFDGAEQLHIDHFREFPEAIAHIPEEAKSQPLVMFCTGGIRCEKAGPLMEQAGFEQVYQLDGGILKYFEECGGQHYHGSCFVFDGRVSLDPALQPTGHVLCFACQAVLSAEEARSEQYLFGQWCPRCHHMQQQRQQLALQQREAEIRERAQAQPGCAAYESLRQIYVPRRLAGLSLIDFLTAWHPPTPRENWQQWLGAGQITAAGRAVDSHRIVKEGERFDQSLPGTTEPAINPDIRLLYEDEWLVVVNKPAPLPVHPSGRFNRNSLSSLMAEAYPKQKLRVAHRLDANTSGVVVLCRTQHAARMVQPQFSTRDVDKLYWARVHGHPTWEETECRVALTAEAQAGGGRAATSDDDLNAQECLTQFRVLRRDCDGTAIVEAIPLTGRTHQIRLHLQSLGHAIVGDPLYKSLPSDVSPTPPLTSDESAVPAVVNSLGNTFVAAPAIEHTLRPEAPPMCLHAAQISFFHPHRKERVTFTAEAPAWMQPSS